MLPSDTGESCCNRCIEHRPSERSEAIHAEDVTFTVDGELVELSGEDHGFQTSQQRIVGETVAFLPG